MDKQFLRKYFMSKLDSAQREVEMLKGAVASLDAEETTSTEEAEAEETPTKKSTKVDAKSSKKSAKKVEEVEEETETEEASEESEDDMFGEEASEEDDQPTVEDVRKIVKSFATKFGKDKALQLLKKFKATAIPDVKKADYAKLIELANKHLKK